MMTEEDARLTRFDADVVSIYAFMDATTRDILYVGQAVDPKTREYEHRTKARIGKSDLPHDAEFVILRECSYRDVSRVEHEIISALKAKGQCRLNRNRGMPANRKTRFVTYELLWVEGSMTFTGPAQAARYFGVSKATVLNALKGLTTLSAPDGAAATLVRKEEAQQARGG
jgi:hypothetical protein